MRTRNVLILIVLALGLMSEALVGKKEVTSQLSVRQEFDSEIHNLKKNIEWSRRTRHEIQWPAFEKTEQEIVQLREESPRQYEPDELYMDIIQASLAEIPRGSDFHRENCEEYRAAILTEFDPQSEEGQVSSPAVKQTLSVLEALCKPDPKKKSGSLRKH